MQAHCTLAISINYRMIEFCLRFVCLFLCSFICDGVMSEGLERVHGLLGYCREGFTTYRSSYEHVTNIGRVRGLRQRGGWSGLNQFINISSSDVLEIEDI